MSCGAINTETARNSRSIIARTAQCRIQNIRHRSTRPHFLALIAASTQRSIGTTPYLRKRPDSNVPNYTEIEEIFLGFTQGRKEKHTGIPKEIPENSIKKNTIRERARGKIILGDEGNEDLGRPAYNLWLARCYDCDQFSIWLYTEMIWPRKNNAPQPNHDMPEDVRKDFLEAGEIVQASPRGAAALLRLAIQKLCVKLGETGKDLNKDIGALVKKGLNSQAQKALDSVRVIGNKAVHPGRIDLSDDVAIAKSLFMLVNLVVDQMISQEARTNEIFESLPPEAREQIARRDNSGE